MNLWPASSRLLDVGRFGPGHERMSQFKVIQ